MFQLFWELHYFFPLDDSIESEIHKWHQYVSGQNHQNVAWITISWQNIEFIEFEKIIIVIINPFFITNADHNKLIVL